MLTGQFLEKEKVPKAERYRLGGASLCAGVVSFVKFSVLVEMILIESNSTDNSSRVEHMQTKYIPLEALFPHQVCTLNTAHHHPVSRFV